MMALALLASITSFSVMAPTSEWMTSMLIFGFDFFFRDSTIASVEPRTSAFTTTFRSLRLPSSIWEKRASSPAATGFAERVSTRFCASRASPRDFATLSDSQTASLVPAGGTPESPTTLTGVLGPASGTRCPRLSIRDFTLP